MRNTRTGNIPGQGVVIEGPNGYVKRSPLSPEGALAFAQQLTMSTGAEHVVRQYEDVVYRTVKEGNTVVTYNGGS